MNTDNPEELPTIAEVIVTWRQARQLKPAELADAAAVPREYLSQVEHGKIKRPADEKLGRLAAALQVPVSTLFLRRLPPSVQQQFAPVPSGETVTPAEVPSAFAFPAPTENDRSPPDVVELERILIRVRELEQLVEGLLDRRRQDG
ncbi:MAG: helix-turn-helix domain-containing protein [Chloroflexota bacterium]|nr:helix-turn-helix domain-containing protein [Chloroflexota bacterium]